LRRAIQSSTECDLVSIHLDDGQVCGAAPVLPRDRWPDPGTFLVLPDPEAVAGVPFVAAVAFDNGAGVVCVADTAARPVTAGFQGLLTDFAALASLHLDQAVRERRLAADAALYRLVAENSADTLIRGTMDGVRRYVSPSVRGLLGYDAAELVGRPARDVVHPDDIEDFGTLARAMRAGEIDTFTTEHRQLHKDGSWVWLEAFVQVTYDEVTGERDGYVAAVRDTSRRKELETKLAHNASHDDLTGLANRSLLYERLQQEIARVARYGNGLALLCLDLDGFKQVNDTLGHDAGDTVLAVVAERLEHCVSGTDTVARRGGDEFVVLHVTDVLLPASATELAQRLIDVVSEPIGMPGGSEVHIGLSVGIALAFGEHTGAESLLRTADAAMYEAKAGGRNCYRCRSTDGDAARPVR
jgi:diguanylate cyclase (GGDEF)-like protein/PAS domain S-box-containing protein